MVLLLNACFALALCASRFPLPTDTGDLQGLPLREIHPTPGAPASDVLVIFITGDGGWAALDREVVRALADHGASVVGLDSRSYLSKRKTPDEVGRDVARIARHYTEQWGGHGGRARRIVLAGYSRGADLLPFALTRFPADLKDRVALVAMLGLAARVGFEFHWQDIVRTVRRAGDQQTLPEVERLRGTRMLCVYGSEETESACRLAPVGLMQTVMLPGKHHFDSDYRALGELIWRSISTTGARS